MKTQEEINEFNKRCALFLGVPNLKDYKGDLWDYLRTSTEIYSVRTSKLRYHSDWNLIHHLIEEINNLIDVVVPLNEVKDSIVPYLNKKQPIRKALLKNDKELVVKAINEFLIWYNKYKNNETETYKI